MQDLLISQTRKDNENVAELTIRSKGDGASARESNLKSGKQQISFGTPGDNRMRFAPFLSNPIFRNFPKGVTEEEAKEIIIKNDFFDKNRNQKGNGFSNRFEIFQFNDDKVIFDHTSHLTWQQHGSLEAMSFEQALCWIDELNKIGYADFTDWRLPTLEEAMSLVKKQKNSGNLFKDQIFGQKQNGIWTSDLTENKTMAWVVFFNYGSCYINCFDLNHYVQPVRS